MSDSYRGDSPQKKLMRGLFWVRAIGFLGARARDARFLFLGSRDGGDATVLKALGISPLQMFAVERVPSAATAFRARHPDVRLVESDVRAVLTAPKVERFDVIHLDLCSRISNESWDVLMLGLKAVGDDGLLSATFLRGRDPIILASAKRLVLQHSKWSGHGERIDARVMFLMCALWENGRRERVATMYRPELSGLYQSSDRHTNGSPMMVFTAQCKRLGPISRDSFNRIANRWWFAELEHIFARGKEYSDLRKIQVDRPMLLATIKELEGIYGTACAAGLLNVSPRTLAAWRAHLTRGTYERDVA